MIAATEFKMLKGYKPLYVSSRLNLLYRKGSLYQNTNITDKPTHIVKLPFTIKQQLLSVFRFSERLFRLEPRVALPVDDETFLVSCCGMIYCADVRTGTIAVEHKYRTGMNNPLNLCVIKGIQGFDDCIAYGEYWGNIGREEVSIYVRKKKYCAWEKVYEFPKGCIQHIHGIIADPYRNGVLILTGDRDEESGLWMATMNFQVVEPVLVGSQRYRSCVAFSSQEGILFASDTPLEKNVITFATQKRNGWSEKILCEIPGPCIYGVQIKNNYVFATSVEPDSQIKGLRYLFTYRLGIGVRDRRSYIIMGNATNSFKEIVCFRKDLYPMLLFQFGNVQFPNGDMSMNFVMYPVSVSQYDGVTLAINTSLLLELNK